MKNNFITLISTIVVAVLFWIFWDCELYRFLPGAHYEGFGAMGYGLYIFIEAFFIIPIAFGIFGFVIAKERRWKQAVLSFFIALAVMVISLFVSGELRDYRIEKAVEQSKIDEIEFNKQVEENRKAKEQKSSE